jgi:hypothetical protein
MPLPSVRRKSCLQCHARTKSRQLQRCLNPAAYGCATCRVHGARKKENILRGKDHPNYQYGYETKEAKQIRQQKFAELDIMELQLRALGGITGSRKRGGKAGYG